MYREIRVGAKPERSGLYIACSADGIRWSTPRQLLAVPAVPAGLGDPLGWHPTLRVEAVDAHTARGWLYYAYSENWGHRPPQKPHYLVGQPITFAITNP